MEELYYCRKDCCPTMYYDKENDHIIITDDFNGKVTLTREQFKILKGIYSKRFEEK